MAIRVALIDMDGTIWDAPIDWPQVRRAIGLPWDGRPILEHLAEMPPKEREHGLQILEQHEAQGVEHGTIVPGTFELLGFLKASHIKCALVSNNSRQSVAAVLRQHELSFDLVLTRDDGVFKPNPDPFLTALERLKAGPNEALVIGDAHLDLLAAQRAGINKIILVGTKPWMRELFPADVSYHQAADLFAVKAIVVRLLNPARG